MKKREAGARIVLREHFIPIRTVVCKSCHKQTIADDKSDFKHGLRNYLVFYYLCSIRP